MAWRGHAHDARRVGGGVTRVTRVLNREIVWGMWMMRKAVYLKVLKGMRETVPFLLPSGPHLLLLCPAFVIPLPLSNLILPSTRSPWFQFHVQSRNKKFTLDESQRKRWRAWETRSRVERSNDKAWVLKLAVSRKYPNRRRPDGAYISSSKTQKSEDTLRLRFISVAFF